MPCSPRPGMRFSVFHGARTSNFLLRLAHSLRKNDFGGDGWSAIFKALTEIKGGKIELWDLSNEDIGPETAKALAEYISVSSTLKMIKCARHSPSIPHVTARLTRVALACTVLATLS